MIMDENSKRLIGIKAIADYLEMSPRNVYRWEKELGLPLHRVAGKLRHRVYADVDELEAWLASHDQARDHVAREGGASGRHRLWSRRQLLLAVSMIAAVLSALILYMVAGNGRQQPLAHVSCNGYMAEARASDGSLLWAYRISDGPINQAGIDLLTSMMDIDGDGHSELVTRAYDSESDEFSLRLFDHHGKILWSRQAGTEQTYGGVSLNNNYRCSQTFFIKDGQGRVLIISVWRNRERFQTIISCHDTDGECFASYQHTGALTTIVTADLDGDGVSEIIFSGTNNLLSGEGIVGVLPLTGFRGVSPPYSIEPEYEKDGFRLAGYVPDNPEIGNQIQYIRFRRLSYLSGHQPLYLLTHVKDVGEEVVNIHLTVVDLKDGESYYMVYVFDHSFRLLQVVPSSALISRYPVLLREGLLEMPIEQLVEESAARALRWEDGEWVAVRRRGD